MDPITILQQLKLQRQFFESHTTYDYKFRKEQLKKLRNAILVHEDELYQALYADLRKTKEESWVTELGFVIAEINSALHNLNDWMKAVRVPTNLLNFPSRSRVVREPLGIVLIISPWNYPFQLLINPLVGAIAAGNCIVLKPSEFAPATESVMQKIIESVFPPEYILYVKGNGNEVIPAMMNHFVFDHVFYTGSTSVGKIIYKMAAENLVPVTLELGGKSPCIVEADANIKVAARRIALTKFSNAGQMCVAPDYVLIHFTIKEAFIEQLKKAIRAFYGDEPVANEAYGKIINTRQFERLKGYMDNGTIEFGGRMDKEKLFIEPTIITGISPDQPVMNDEIFGPILSVIPFTNPEEAKAIISRHANPLSFYVFTSSRQKEKYWIENIPAGGGCINNASWHLTNHQLPFGGRGYSGTGNYHGKYSFDTFSHQKSIMKTPTWFDPALKYPPFKGKLKLFKWIVR